MIDATREEKLHEFQALFGEMISLFNDKGMDAKQIINAMGCSICLLAMASEDPKGYMADITEKMNMYVAALSNGADLVAAKT